MGLETNSGKITYLNIKEGKLSFKDAKGEKVTADAISGVITKVEFSIEEYLGREVEKAKITIVDGNDKYLLQMGVDSGYFRGFCNSLRSGDYTKKVRIAPFFADKDGKKSSTCFVEQNGKALKHFFTKDNPGELPPVEKVTFKGKDNYDGTKQIEYWKNWLLSLKLESEFLQGGVNHDEEVDKGGKNSVQISSNVDSDLNPDNDDLPF
jgi:hypothetical protein